MQPQQQQQCHYRLLVTPENKYTYELHYCKMAEPETYISCSASWNLPQDALAEARQYCVQTLAGHHAAHCGMQQLQPTVNPEFEKHVK